RFQHLKNPGFIVDDHPPALLRSRTELTDFPGAPVRIEIARRQNRDENGGLRELIDNFIGKDIVSLQFIVSPDFGSLAESHAQERLERGVKAADPAFLFRR